MKRLVPLLILCLAPTFTLSNTIGSIQSVAVRGQVICESTPAANVTISLNDENVISITFMANVTTGSNGEFELNGTATEISNIDPCLYIHHRCLKTTDCYHELKVDIPDEYITKGEVPEKVFDLGVIQLAARYNNYIQKYTHNYYCL
ncbi:hypothetical protein QR680_015015 [Steinernema hermaphroditum]|uniref:Uncharacterized protein n=1 Tax=Steinernema hermaphroditum TaxID=289476 RepID=A0AA39ICE4_9BILA|nr:hypothetical protein QR680_015015 [Steinernema hermaphroditum]